VGLSVEIVLLLVALGAFGGLVQGSVGFGLGAIASPIVALVRPELVPVAIMMAGGGLPLATIATEWRHIDWAAFGWVMLGRLPATVAGVLIVAAVPARVLQGLVGAIVLLMVVISAIRLTIPRTRLTLVGAGALTGLTGTASGIGGPPIAIVLADDPPPRARATMGLVFLVGVLVGLAGLAAAGSVTPDAVGGGLVLLPAAVVGFTVSVRVRRHLSNEGFRRGVLLLSAVTAAILLVRVLLG